MQTAVIVNLLQSRLVVVIVTVKKLVVKVTTVWIARDKTHQNKEKKVAFISNLLLHILFGIKKPLH